MSLANSLRLLRSDDRYFGFPEWACFDDLNNSSPATVLLYLYLVADAVIQVEEVVALLALICRRHFACLNVPGKAQELKL